MGVAVATVVILALLTFISSDSVTNSDSADEPCIITVLGGNKLCGDDARAWCDQTDNFRSLDPSQTEEAQAACDEVREY